MYKWIHKYKLRVKWQQYQQLRTKDINLLTLAYASIDLFNDYNYPRITLSKATHYYIESANPSLYNMLSEFTQAVTEYQTTNKITPIDSLESKSIRLDTWCLRDNQYYTDVLIYDCYLEMTKLLSKLQVTTLQVNNSYIERRCKKCLLSYLTLVDVLGTIVYVK